MAKKSQQQQHKTKFGNGIYPSYHWGKLDHDPMIDGVMTVIKDSGMKRTVIAQKSGVTIGTIGNWDKRKTKRPQFTTLNAVARACGADIQLMYKGHVIKLKTGG